MMARQRTIGSSAILALVRRHDGQILAGLPIRHPRMVPEGHPAWVTDSKEAIRLLELSGEWPDIFPTAGASHLDARRK